MQFVSVLDGNKAPTTASLAEAALLGWAPDGGMYWPRDPPKLARSELRHFAAWSYPQLCVHFLQLFTRADDDELSHTDIDAIVGTAFASFASEGVVPLVSLEAAGQDPLHIGELWHGPTLAFKDLGMSVLGRVLNHLLARRNDRLTLLVGTSGDTGSSAMEVCMWVLCTVPNGLGTTPFHVYILPGSPRPPAHRDPGAVPSPTILLDHGRPGPAWGDFLRAPATIAIRASAPIAPTRPHPNAYTANNGHQHIRKEKADTFSNLL